MARVITFSRVFPAYHPRRGEPTYFVEKIWNSVGMPSFGKGLPWGSCWCDTPLTNEYFRFVSDHDDIYDCYKNHTIRAGHRWKAGDYFSPRVWSGSPYRSKQIQFAPDIKIEKVWDFGFDGGCSFELKGKYIFAYNESVLLEPIAKNDGLKVCDFISWFPKAFTGQIICWNPEIEY